MVQSHVVIYTDGSCEPNPGPGGWAAILHCGDQEKVLTGREAHTTNNRMELLAAISALEALRVTCQVELHTDSRYLQQGITLWLPNWIAHGWRKSDRQPVLNVDLWQRLHAQTQRHEVHWVWVRGHRGNALNERADRLASQALRGKLSVAAHS